MDTAPIKRPPPVQDDPATWYTRTEVARLLNMSRDNVRYLERSNTFHPVRDAQGQMRFSPQEVSAYAATAKPRRPDRRRRGYRTAAQIEASAYAMFDQGKGLPDIVAALEIEAAEVRRLYGEWTLSLEEGEHVRRQREQQERETERLRLRLQADERVARERRLAAESHTNQMQALLKSAGIDIKGSGKDQR